MIDTSLSEHLGPDGQTIPLDTNQNSVAFYSQANTIFNTMNSVKEFSHVIHKPMIDRFFLQDFLRLPRHYNETS